MTDSKRDLLRRLLVLVSLGLLAVSVVIGLYRAGPFVYLLAEVVAVLAVAVVGVWCYSRSDERGALAFFPFYLTVGLAMVSFSAPFLLESEIRSWGASSMQLYFAEVGGLFLCLWAFGYSYTVRRLTANRRTALVLARQALEADDAAAAETLWDEAERMARRADIRPPTRANLRYLLDASLDSEG